jgi:3D (Asp-Asp-Asp) domain-containing protein
MREQIIKPLHIIFLTLIVVILGNWIYLNKLEKDFEHHLKLGDERIGNQEQSYECKIDSLLNVIEELKTTFDSIPTGIPLDTLVIQDGYGVRKHPIFGRWQMHSGIDLIDSWHDTVYSTASGTVNFSGWNYGYGRCVEIEHAFSFITKYAHLHKLFVNKEDNVIKGQAIGIMGNTGDVTGPHLHYEISHDGKTIDPMPYINCRPISVKATMYHPVEGQCDDTPLITADGSVIDPYSVSDWNWIAVSQDMLVRNGGILNYGDEVYIKGTHKDGIYTIHDCMNRRKTAQIDFLENVGTKQYKYKDIDLYVLK